MFECLKKRRFLAKKVNFYQKSLFSAPNCEIRPYISKFGPKSDLILSENQTKIGPKIR